MVLIVNSLKKLMVRIYGKVNLTINRGSFLSNLKVFLSNTVKGYLLYLLRASQ